MLAMLRFSGVFYMLTKKKSACYFMRNELGPGDVLVGVLSIKEVAAPRAVFRPQRTF